MDIKSIIRVVRFNELQSRADRDPEARRPPTVKFMGVALVLGLLLVLISFWSAPQTDGNVGVAMQVDSTSPALGENTTSPSAPGEQEGPENVETGADEARAARPQDGP